MTVAVAGSADLIGCYFLVVMTYRGPWVPIGCQRVSATGHPAVGDEIVLRGMPHVVTCVRHVDRDHEYDEGYRVTSPVVYVTPCYAAPRRRRSKASR